MTKKQIVKQIADRIEETQLKTKEIVQLTFEAIVDTLISDRRIELRNFGVFEVKLRKARNARNPRTNDPVNVPPKFVVTFKPGKEMEERVKKLTPLPHELAALDKPKAAALAAAAAAAQLSQGGDSNGTSPPDGQTVPKKKKRPRKTAPSQAAE